MHSLQDILAHVITAQDSIGIVLPSNEWVTPPTIFSGESRFAMVVLFSANFFIRLRF